MRIRIVWALLALVSLLVSMQLRAQQYTPALPGYQYEFPRDHFNHPGYQTEWWYYTGNLRAKDGHRFGFELTFFRQGVSRQVSDAPWNVRDLYMAHLALSDVSGGHYYATERINRAGPGIAGVDPASGLVWNGNWKTKIGPNEHELQGIGDHFSFTLNAVPQKPPVIQGVDGVSQKAEGAGHASHYVSFTRMRTTGSLELNGTVYTVEGDAWMDHEFFSESTGGDEVGWDWLSIQLADDSELMLYRLRHKDGSVDPYSSGTYVDPQGKAMHLALSDFSMKANGAAWKSDTTGASYPIDWSVEIPKLNLQMSITTPLKDQEFVSRVGPSYWEGAIDVRAERAGKPVQGSGYLEMTGYSQGQTPFLATYPR